MYNTSGILEVMMSPDFRACQDYMVTHHQVSNPGRIDVRQDEVVFIHNIEIDSRKDYWLEYHSATESRFIEGSPELPEKVLDQIVTRHKGNVYFTLSGEYNYKVYYVKLKIIS